MREFLLIIAKVAITGIVVLLCLFSWLLAIESDQYWEELKREKKKNERH